MKKTVVLALLDAALCVGGTMVFSECTLEAIRTGPSIIMMVAMVWGLFYAVFGAVSFVKDIVWYNPE